MPSNWAVRYWQNWGLLCDLYAREQAIRDTTEAKMFTVTTDCGVEAPDAR